LCLQSFQMKSSKSRIRLRLLRAPWERRSEGTLRIRWRVFLTYLGVIALCLWLLTASAFFYFVKYNAGYQDVRFAHIVGLPWTLKIYRQAKGEYFLQQGLAAASESKWGEAFNLLQIGLPSNPDNEEARLTLARIYLMAQRPDQAKTLFLDGLKIHGNQTEYLRTVLTFLFGQQADSTVVEIAATVLSRTDISPELRRTLLLARFYAHFNRDQFREAENSIKGTEVEAAPQVEVVEARIAWEQGLQESALISLRSLQTRRPQDDDVYRVLQTYLRERGLLDEARRLALSRQLAFPQKPDAYIDFIELCAEKGMDSQGVDAAEDFLRLFATDGAALMRFQALAAQQGWSDQAKRVVKLLKSVALQQQTAAAALALEADIKRKAYNDALRYASEWLREHPLLHPSEQMGIFSMEALAYYGVGVEAEGTAKLERVFSSSATSPAALLTVGRHLKGLGKLEMAERAFSRAIELDPIYPGALVSLLQLKLESQRLDESISLIERLAGTRKPPPQLTQGILKALQSDYYLYVEARDSAIRALRPRVQLINQS
jgi:tetratricopeptide (TPR) repeat protein